MAQNVERESLMSDVGISDLPVVGESLVSDVKMADIFACGRHRYVKK